MISHYLQKSNHSLMELCNLSFIEKCFYITSMIICNKEKGEIYSQLAMLSNPFLEKK